MLQFDSFNFFSDLFAALVVVVPIFRFVKVEWLRRLILILAGVYLLAVIAPRLALFYVVYWLAVWGGHLLVAALAERRGNGVVLSFTIIALLAPMLLWKAWTADFVIDFNLISNSWVLTLMGRWGAVDLVRDIILPLGLSFATFRAIDLVIKTYVGVLDRLTLDRVLFFGMFPPVLLIGPVIQYPEIADTRKDNTRVWQDFRAGLLLVMSGLFKVFLVAYPLQGSSALFTAVETNAAWVLWVELALFALYFFLNFAGYSDLAVGAARFLGYDISRNFDWPYLKTNPQDFWNSWHMSLTHFFQRNVFVPVGGMRERTQYLAIFLTIMAIALWHDLSIPLVMFGLYHATGLISHRYLKSRRPPRDDEPTLLRLPKMAVMFAFFAFSLPLMVITTDQIIPVYGALLGLS